MELIDLILQFDIFLLNFMDQLIDSEAESKDILPSLETNPQL